MIGFQWNWRQFFLTFLWTPLAHWKALSESYKNVKNDLNPRYLVKRNYCFETKGVLCISKAWGKKIICVMFCGLSKLGGEPWDQHYDERYVTWEKTEELAMWRPTILACLYSQVVVVIIEKITINSNLTVEVSHKQPLMQFHILTFH
jgi:hypothetical protein